MRLMTFNTHSLIGPDAGDRLQQFVRCVLAEKPDVIALQEVNQHADAEAADAALLTGYVPVRQPGAVRGDNYAAHAARLLREAGVPCGWTYLPVKLGYGRFDEGLALLSPGRELGEVKSCLLSRTDDYRNWKTRRALLAQVIGLPGWFCCVHMGWWTDGEEPFLQQWEALSDFLRSRRSRGPVWLMGDFNAPAELRGEGYDRIVADGWQDAYHLARERDGCVTIPGRIDGWAEAAKAGVRIDQIWCSQRAEVASCRVVLDGRGHPAASDHYAVMAEIREAPPQERGQNRPLGGRT